MASVETIKYRERIDTETRKRVRYNVPKSQWRYQARWRDPQGKPKAKNFNLKGDAERFLQRIGVSIQDGEYVDPKRRRERFDDWAKLWWKTTNQLAPHSRRGYWQELNTTILPAFGNWRVVDINFMDIEEFIADQFEAGYSWKTIRGRVSIVTLIMDGPMRAGLRRDNPARGHRIKSKRKPITEGDVLDLPELMSLISHVRDPYKAAVWLLVLTGMRPEELAGLRIRNVDFLNSVVSVEETLTPVAAYDGHKRAIVAGPPKTAAGYRKISVPPWLTEELSTMVSARFSGRPVDRDAYLFTQPKGGLFDTDKFRTQTMIPALRAAGLPLSFRTYDVRHSHASILVAMGATPPEVAMQMGHANPAVSQRIYVHLFKGAQEAMNQKLADRIAELMKQPPTVISLAAAATGAARLPVPERRRRVAELHSQGRSIGSMAAQFGVSWQTIQRDVRAASGVHRNAQECTKTGETGGSKGQPRSKKKAG